MAKISLREYNREIEGLIETGRLDEAVAHCQHILKSFSMHLGTYQLLGKAFLEAHRYTDAADIFQRILNATPDDFIAHVGMSIIRDDEGKLDDAIWHMERAFEVQPSNPAIQGELRRLYGRRDGTEPNKIRLSRDALANMYAQGELFNQAIAEIKTILAVDPDRPDLQVMLARAYFRTGQKVEAAEIAAHLLKKYSYCLDALRILVEVLPGSARAENSQVYRQRLRLLDPYSAFVTDSVFSSDQVADSTVNLERMEYIIEKQPTSSQPTWASSLGVKLDDGQMGDSQPEWLNGTKEAEVHEISSPVSGGNANQDNQEIPDFLRSAGWGETDGIAEESEIADSSASDELVKAEIPDWLKSQIPPELSQEAQSIATHVDEAGADFPDWLTSIGTPTDTSHSSEAQSQQQVGDNELGLGPHSTESEMPIRELGGEESEIPPANETAEDFTSQLDGRMSGATQEPEAAVAGEQSEELPGWLGSTGEAPSSQEQKIPEEDFSLPETDNFAHQTESREFNIPISDDTNGEKVELVNNHLVGGEVQQESSPIGQSTKPLGIEDDTMAWLEGLAAKQGAKPEELLTKPEDRSDDLPKWLINDSEEKTSGAMDNQAQLQDTNKAKIGTVPSGDLDDSLRSRQLSPTEELDDLQLPVDIKSAVDANATGDNQWMEGLQDEQAMPDQELDLKPERTAEELPEWLRGDGQMAEPMSKELPPGDIPEATSPKVEAESSAEEDITITSWLKNLEDSGGQEPSTKGQELSVAQAASDDDIPDWLKDITERSVVSGESTANESSELRLDEPEWLTEPSQSHSGQIAPQLSTEESGGRDVLEEDGRDIVSTDSASSTEWVPADNRNTGQGFSHTEEMHVEPDAEKPPSVLRDTGALSSIPSEDKDASLLADAQQMLASSYLEESMKEYSKLIKKGRLLEEVIHDLREALYRFPVDIIVWQTLGDAYMRANRLQDALDAYTKAEELLR